MIGKQLQGQPLYSNSNMQPAFSLCPQITQVAPRTEANMFISRKQVYVLSQEQNHSY